ncbi:32549_t:CDS:10, partial [Racocetra persica]
APNVVLLSRENYLMLLRLMEQNEAPITIDDEDLQLNTEEITTQESGPQLNYEEHTQYCTSNSQSNTVEKITIQESAVQNLSFDVKEDSANKKSNPSDDSNDSAFVQLSNAIEKDQKNEIKGLDSVASPLNHEESGVRNEIQVLESSIQEQSTNNSQLNTTKESGAQNLSFDIEEDNTNKNANFSDDSDAFISVAQSLNQKKSDGQLFNAIEKDQRNESHSSVQDILASSSIINSQVPSTPPQNITKGNLSDLFIDYQALKQSNDSLSTTTGDTDFLHSNNQDESTKESHKSDSEIENQKYVNAYQGESNEADECSNL